MAKVEYNMDWGDLKKVVINLKSEGIQDVLKSSSTNDKVREVARDIKKEVENLTGSDEWDIKYHDRPSRVTWVVYTDSIDEKWREIQSGKIAKWIRRNLIRGKVRRPGE